MSGEAIADINSFRYQERFHLSDEQMDAVTQESIDRAVFIWSLDNERVKLNEGSQANY